MLQLAWCRLVAWTACGSLCSNRCHLRTSAVWPFSPGTYSSSSCTRLYKRMDSYGKTTGHTAWGHILPVPTPGCTVYRRMDSFGKTTGHTAWGHLLLFHTPGCTEGWTLTVRLQAIQPGDIFFQFLHQAVQKDGLLR